MREFLSPNPETLDQSSGDAIARTALITTLGFALYGFTVGYWRSPLMGVYVAVKMPLLIACTLGFNSILNGLLGLLLGSGLGFRQSLHALLSAFAISALILGSISPVTFFFALNAPAPDSSSAITAHATYLLFHTALIGIAGIVGVLRLSGLLHRYCVSSSIARSTLAAWIFGNAFLGMQFSWIFRPFFGSPHLEVAFLREDPMKGNFLNTVWKSLLRITEAIPPSNIPLGAILVCTGSIIAVILIHETRKANLTTKQP
ncbi:hypothetical protein ACFQY0_05940 [Haloferula chungangensis]|uniref:Uncharacterized protein n=1 Tax=Haloferula chungangensis TaxID=1048331 RepID=A0ABW2L5Z1_9BACT